MLPTPLCRCWNKPVSRCYKWHSSLSMNGDELGKLAFCPIIFLLPAFTQLLGFQIEGCVTDKAGFNLKSDSLKSEWHLILSWCSILFIFPKPCTLTLISYLQPETLALEFKVSLDKLSTMSGWRTHQQRPANVLCLLASHGRTAVVVNLPILARSLQTLIPSFL